MLNQISLNGKNKIDIAIERIKAFEPEEGYFLAFSGGKDSITIKKLADMAEIKYDAHFNLTTVDPPEVVRFVMKEYPDVQLHRPRFSMWKLIIKEGIPPTMKVRYCCEHLKEGRDSKIDQNRFVITGVRWEESAKRRKRKMIEVCTKTVGKRFLHPIIDWTESEVWEFINLFKLNYCSLYNEGYKRIGCIMCPMAGVRGRERDMVRFPKYYQMYLRTFERMLEERKKKHEDEWQTAEEVMNWWIYGQKKINEFQESIFD